MAKTTSNRKGKSSRDGQGNGVALESLLNVHRRHHGIFARVAESLSVDPSYVSRVANGKRRSPEIEKALSQELRRIASR